MKIRFHSTLSLLAIVMAIQASAATILVTSTADNGSGSIRDALAIATNGDLIDASGLSGTITLATGELLVTNSVTIKGPGPAHLLLDGNFPAKTNRIFNVQGGVTVNISDLTITNGNASPGSGGGILNLRSSLTLSNCAIKGCSALGGGGILSAALFSGTANLTILNSIIAGNSATVGGGIYNQAQQASAMVSMLGSVVSSNSAGDAGGGGIKNQGADFSTTATSSITNSTITGNFTSGKGGGIQNDGFQGNAKVIMVNTTLNGNSANSGGGGLFNNDSGASGLSSLTILNSTLSGNSTGGRGGAILNGFSGSGATPLVLVSSTLASNSAPALGGGIYNVGSVQVGNTIFKAGSSGSNVSSSASRTITSSGFNLSNDSGGDFLTNATDQINSDPLLGPLQDNGGPVYTHALSPGSPAIDQGKNLSDSAFDARGSARTFDDSFVANAVGGDATDIGAYETFDLRVTAIQKTGNDLHLSFTSVSGLSYEVQTETNPTSTSWWSLPGAIQAQGGMSQVVLTNAFDSPQKFFRVHQLP